jgi:hypothetical protein
MCHWSRQVEYLIWERKNSGIICNEAINKNCNDEFPFSSGDVQIHALLRNEKVNFWALGKLYSRTK